MPVTGFPLPAALNTSCLIHVVEFRKTRVRPNVCRDKACLVSTWALRIVLYALKPSCVTHPLRMNLTGWKRKVIPLQNNYHPGSAAIEGEGAAH